MSLAATLPAHLRPRREKVFGDGRPRALDRNAKVRIMHQARALSRRTAKGKAYGPITAKALAVLEALLWGFHNARSGLCFPSYETIAAKAGCARSTVAEAIKALEEAGILSWVNRITRVRDRMPDLFGQLASRWRVIRISNAYHFRDPRPGGGTQQAGDRGNSSKSEFPSGTQIQELPSSLSAPSPAPIDPTNPVGAALLRLQRAITASSEGK
jgi:DNA-binding MarR family transcriptional regulator